MQKIPIDDAKYIIFDEATNTSKVVVIAEVERTLQSAQERLSELPEAPSDEELLEWARANYPMMDYSKERETLEGVISENSKLLSEIK